MNVFTLTLADLVSRNINQLKSYCRDLNLSGYSKLKKGDLVSLLSDELGLSTQPRSLLEPKKQKVKNTQPEYELFSASHIRKNLGDVTKKSEEEFELILTEYCQDLLATALARGYSFNTISGSLTRKLKGSNVKTATEVVVTEGQVDLIKFHDNPTHDRDRRNKFITAWNIVLRPMRKVQALERELELEIASHVDFEVIEIDNLKAINWAIANLNNPTPEVSALALAITGGRRSLEICGTAQFTIEGECLVRIKGIAKSQYWGAEGVFPTLVPAKDWVEALNSLGANRGLTDIAVNKRYAQYFTRKGKALLQSIGLKVFKDSRDVYAMTCLATMTGVRQFKDHTRTLQRILCHAKADSTENYKKYDVQPYLPALPALIDFEKHRCRVNS